MGLNCLASCWLSVQNIIIDMFEWRLSAIIKECSGICINLDLQYSLLLKLGNKFSHPLLATQATSAAIIFNDTLELEFTTAGCDLPSPNLQLLLVGSESMLSPRGVNTRKEQILAIATLPIAYPLPQSLAVPTRQRFDKPADSKANIRVSFSLTREDPSPRRQRARSPSPSPTKTPSKSEETRREQGESKKDRREEELSEVLKERNQLYKMSENLYGELKKCMAERDEYLRQLREKQLSEQQIKEELQFLRMKLEEENENALLQQMEELRCENEEMRSRLSDRQTDLKELQRRVKQSMIAMDQFRREAVSARTDLIHKESELSLISKQSKHPDFVDYIEELQRELECRREEAPFIFEEDKYEINCACQWAEGRVKKEVALLFAHLMGRMKLPRERQWLLQEKVGFEKKLEAIFNPS